MRDKGAHARVSQQVLLRRPVHHLPRHVRALRSASMRFKQQSLCFLQRFLTSPAAAPSPPPAAQRNCTRHDNVASQAGCSHLNASPAVPDCHPNDHQPPGHGPFITNIWDFLAREESGIRKASEQVKHADGGEEPKLLTLTLGSKCRRQVW